MKYSAILAIASAGAATLLLAASPTLALTMYGEVQRTKIDIVNGTGPQFHWITSGSAPTAVLSSDPSILPTSAALASSSARRASTDAPVASAIAAAAGSSNAAALIMSGTGIPDPNIRIEFDFLDRYLVGPDPTVTISFQTPTGFFPPMVKFENLLFSKFTITEASTGYKHAARTVKKPDGLVATRVAVVAKPDGASPASFNVRNLKIDGKSADEINLNTIIDRKAVDQLLNVASHTEGI